MKVRIPLSSIKIAATIAVVLVVGVTVASLQGVFGPVSPESDETTLPVLTEPSVSELAETAGLIPTNTVEASDTTEASEIIADTEGTEDTSAGDAGAIAARRVNGKTVPLTWDELAEFEKQLYACKTVAEYEKIMSTLAYYNRGVDMSRFPWYWDELADLYSDEEIAMMKSGDKTQKAMPDFIGMEVKTAYQYSLKYSVIIRFVWACESNDQPVGYCYRQDAAPGQKINPIAGWFVYVQAPAEIGSQYIMWDPDDWDFDIYDHVQIETEPSLVLYEVPNVIGLCEADAVAALENIGMSANVVRVSLPDTEFDYGYVFNQQWPAGYQAETAEMSIFVQDYQAPAPTTESAETSSP